MPHLLHDNYTADEVGKCARGMVLDVSRAHLPTSSTVYHAVDVTCITLEKLEDL